MKMLRMRRDVNPKLITPLRSIVLGSHDARALPIHIGLCDRTLQLQIFGRLAHAS